MLTQRLVQRLVFRLTRRLAGARRAPGTPVTLAQPTNLTVEEV